MMPFIPFKVTSSITVQLGLLSLIGNCDVVCQNSDIGELARIHNIAQALLCTASVDGYVPFGAN